MTAIRTEHLTHVYSEGSPFQKTAVEDISIDIPQGEYVGVIGHTGSGKSTLIQHFNGLLKPTSGQVFVGDQDIWADKTKLRGFRFQVGLVFQYPEHQLFGETVYKDIAFGPGNMGLEEGEIDARVRQAARFVGLKEEYLDKSPFELSGGQKRRVAIAGVLAMNPRCVVLDEPTAGVDAPSVQSLYELLSKLNRETGLTIVMVTHDIGRAEYVAVTDEEAVCAFEYLSKTEGIIPAIESAHALAYAMKIAPGMKKDDLLVVTLSGRGDKDCAAIARYRGEDVGE